MKNEEQVKKEVKRLEYKILQRIKKNPIGVQLPLQYRLKALRWVLE